MTLSPPRIRTRVHAIGGVPPEPLPSADDAPGGTPRVGYCRPPAEHQFKPGHSGNPRGRPKGSRNFAKIVSEMLARRIRTKVNGETQRILPAEALAQVVLHKAIKGDRHAWEKIFGWIDETEASKERRDAVRSIDERDAEILRQMKERYLERGPNP